MATGNLAGTGTPPLSQEAFRGNKAASPGSAPPPTTTTGGGGGLVVASPQVAVCRVWLGHQVSVAARGVRAPQAHSASAGCRPVEAGEGVQEPTPLFSQIDPIYSGVLFQQDDCAKQQQKNKKKCELIDWVTKYKWMLICIEFISRCGSHFYFKILSQRRPVKNEIHSGGFLELLEPLTVTWKNPQKSFKLSVLVLGVVTKK